MAKRKNEIGVLDGKIKYKGKITKRVDIAIPDNVKKKLKDHNVDEMEVTIELKGKNIRSRKLVRCWKK